MVACPQCLLRGAVLRRLAAHIDRIVDRGAGERARDLLALSDADLARASTASDGDADAALAAARAAAGELPSQLAALGCWSICRHHRLWPRGLAALGEAAPRALFGSGKETALAELDSQPAASIVGARRAGTYGRDVAKSLAGELGAAGVGVVSGLAFGIDTAAHEGALGAGGLTVAVLGTGPERAYPRSRQSLYRRIVSDGLVLSELPPETPTFRWMFPARNRIMAALGGMTLVVEAAERSGSLITTEMAADIGRPVGAVPGPIDSWRSSGANRLLAEGAIVVRGATDVLDCLLGPGSRAATRMGRPLDPDQIRICEEIAAGAATQDEVARRTGLPAPRSAAAIATLELEGYVLSDAVGRLRRSQMAAPDEADSNTLRADTIGA